MTSFERQPQPQDSVELAKQSIMSAEEYAVIEHEQPYIYEVESGNKKITYFGSPHSYSPTDPIWRKLKQKFKDLDPDLVLVEGNPKLQEYKQHYIDAAVEHDEDEFIKKMGEGGLAVKLAADK